MKTYVIKIIIGSTSLLTFNENTKHPCCDIDKEAAQYIF